MYFVGKWFSHLWEERFQNHPEKEKSVEFSERVLWITAHLFLQFPLSNVMSFLLMVSGPEA